MNAESPPGACQLSDQDNKLVISSYCRHTLSPFIIIP